MWCHVFEFKGQFTSCTMKTTHGRWFFFPCSVFMVQLPWSDFLKNQFTKPLGPSLGVNWMWTKRNDHVLKSECIFFFLIYVQKRKFWRNLSVTMLLSSLVFIFYSKKICHYKITITIFPLPWALALFYHSTSFASPTVKFVGPCQLIIQALKYVFWEPQIHGHSNIFFLGVNWSGPRTSSIANHKYYKALGRLHGP